MLGGLGGWGVEFLHRIEFLSFPGECVREVFWFRRVSVVEEWWMCSLL